jgi:hypothetical protein
MPELIYDKAEDVPAALKDIAKEKDGKFIANVVAKAELDDFRQRNINVSQERDNLQSTIGRLTTDLALDPQNLDGFVEEIKELRDVKQQVDDGKLVKDTSLAQAVESKTAEMRRSYEERIRGLETSNKTLTSDNEKLKSDVNRSIIDREVMKAIGDPKSGARPEATQHILREAYEVYKVEDGKLVPKDASGNVIYGTDGASPMSPKEWLVKQQEATPFFFKEAQGGGGGGGGGNGGGPLSPAAIAEMSPEEKMNYGREHGLDGRSR